MSSHYSYYEKIDGKLAFLSGNISALSDECLCNIIPKYWAVEADVFKADANDICGSMRRKDTLQLVLESETEEEKDFYEMVGNFLLQRRQKEVVERNLF